MDIKSELLTISNGKINWKKTTRPGLDIDYTIFLPKKLSDQLFHELEQTISYPEESKVRIFGKWLRIPRQQVAFGDPGTTYKFSGTTVPARPWPDCLSTVREALRNATGYDFNFVLVNRYRNGTDHIGEHRDSEPDLDPNFPIASVSLGEPREFVFKHGDARKKSGRKPIPVVKITLGHGSVLMMNPPTNVHWYHSLPARKSSKGVRINLTFRRIRDKTLRL